MTEGQSPRHTGARLEVPEVREDALLELLHVSYGPPESLKPISERTDNVCTCNMEEIPGNGSVIHSFIQSVT